ncbi:MAG: trypsin-like peptidase domain-containing protein [Planctomycetia bacterium]|nr:trypsin-like peptidase domain-containing protein [Planctomycetia bacterium]
MQKKMIMPVILATFLANGLILGLFNCVQSQTRERFLPLRYSERSDEEYQEDLTPEEKNNIRIYENACRSVVNISTQIRREFFFQEAIEQGEGSGVVIDKAGHVLTNFHVVAGASEVEVTLFNGNTYSAKVIGGDPANDSAVLRVSAPEDELYPCVFGNSSRLKVGQKVYAIGNPFGLEQTLTTGVISSLNRQLPSQRQNRTIKQVIQIDAAINPGNSGGPLLDSYGEVIGMNTAIATRSGGSHGVGFAIPVNTLTRILPQLIQHGRVLRPNLGIEQVMETDEGLLITRVQPGGPAAEAGLAAPKIITQRRSRGSSVYIYRTVDRDSAQVVTAVNGQAVHTVDDLLSVVESYKPGEVVRLTLLQAGQKREVSVRLAQQEE